MSEGCIVFDDQYSRLLLCDFKLHARRIGKGLCLRRRPVQQTHRAVHRHWGRSVFFLHEGYLLLRSVILAAARSPPMRRRESIFLFVKVYTTGGDIHVKMSWIL